MNLVKDKPENWSKFRNYMVVGGISILIGIILSISFFAILSKVARSYLGA